MPTYTIAKIEVQFPFEAYPCQLHYMEKVILALQNGQNALLESPTGTGKTLCLLCAALAWQQTQQKTKAGEALGSGGAPGGSRVGSQGGEPGWGPRAGSQLAASDSFDQLKSRLGVSPIPGVEGGEFQPTPRIVYASRTHSQLQQVVGQLRASGYRPKMAVEGSRERMCIEKEVSQLKGHFQNFACRSKRKTRSCWHGSQVEGYLQSHADLGKENPVDIEDLVKIGREQGPCPYYLSRELAVKADIVFVPYNYVIDRSLREGLKLEWSNSVLIVDEAHNVESVCSDASSFDLTAAQLAGCIAEATRCVEQMLEKQGDEQEGLEEYRVLKGLLLELERQIHDLPLPSNGLTKPGKWIYEFLAELNISWDTVDVLKTVINNAVDFLNEERLASKTTAGGGGGTQASFRLQVLHSALECIFMGDKKQNFASSFKVHISEEKGKGDRKGGGGVGSSTPRTLSFWCFNPGIAMQAFKRQLGVRSLILTSGTLSPLDSFANELNIPFDVRLENPHVIEPSQIWVGVVSKGPSGKALNSSFKTRESPEYLAELGNALVNFSRIVPDGLLVFFPSYNVLCTCVDSWQAPGVGGGGGRTIWERISQYKHPVVEPRESAMFNEVNESFLTALKEEKGGAIFFAVCRGKVSEGLDFADRAGRAVVITGIPYAPFKDTKVELKMEYLNDSCKAFRNKESAVKGLSGSEWYTQSATRAVNQAVGRVIRHRNDYGAIILCDERLGQHKLKSLMSTWLKPYIQDFPRFGDAALTLTKFFREKVNKPPIVTPQTWLASANQASMSSALDGVPLPLDAKAVNPETNFAAPSVPQSMQLEFPLSTAPFPQSNSHPPTFPGPKMGEHSGGGGGLLARLSGNSLGSSSGAATAPGGERQSMSAMLAARRAQEQRATGGGSMALDASPFAAANGAVGSRDGTRGTVGPGGGSADGLGAGFVEDVKPVIMAPPHVLEELQKKAKAAMAQKRAQESVTTRVGISAKDAMKAKMVPVGGVKSEMGSQELLARGEGRGGVTSGGKGDDGNGRHNPAGAELADKALAGAGSVCAAVKEEPEEGGTHGRGCGSGEVQTGGVLASGRAAARPLANVGVKRERSEEAGDGGRGLASRQVESKQGPSAEGPVVATGQGQGSLGSGVERGKGEGGGKKQKPQEAALYIKLVKSRLSATEFAEFFRFMRGLRSQALGVEELLDGVTQLFAAPDRLDLLQMFGQFVSQEHRATFSQRLKSHAGNV